MVVEATADLVPREEVGQIVLFSGSDFSTVFAEFGRDEG
jgi:hypothetical protein